jgi:phosphoglycerate dehydrogenase-like enzyme
MKNKILVSYSPGKAEKKIYQEVLKDLAHIAYLPESPQNRRIQLLNSADVIIALSFSQKEINHNEVPHLKKARFIQLVFAGADNIPFELIPKNILIATNVGAFAKPIAEHVLALALALAKELLPRYKLLCKGRFEQSGFLRKLNGGTCGIIGLGGNGMEIAKTMRVVGMKVHGINRSGKTDADVDFIGKVADMKRVLQASHVVVVTTPLNRETRNLIGKRELEWMKADAILINVGRGDVINQRSLYEHLRSNPDFRAGIDTWWSEPTSHGEFRLEYPFFELPNFIGSPHIADHVPDSMPNATRKALENVRDFLAGKGVRGLLKREDYLTL